jgi:hypothetical protein
MASTVKTTSSAIAFGLSDLLIFGLVLWGAAWLFQNFKGSFGNLFGGSSTPSLPTYLWSQQTSGYDPYTGEYNDDVAQRMLDNGAGLDQAAAGFDGQIPYQDLATMDNLPEVPVGS